VTTKDRSFVKFRELPSGGIVTGDFLVTFCARIKTTATFELDRDDIELGVPMSAAALGVYVDTVYDDLV
jgi:hypothetical protein